MHDLIVIGGGPAGYVAAERAGEHGLSTLLFDSGEHGGGLGGVCLNTGCIPTKSLLHCAKLFEHARHGEAFGVNVEKATFDYAVAKERTDGIQKTLRDGVAGLMKKNKVEVVEARAKFVGPRAVEANGTVHEAREVLVCTGSRPAMPPVDGLRGNDRVLTNESILALETMPEHLAVIGGGVIGVEFACLYACVGRKVTVVEMLPKICGPLDKELSKTVRNALEKKGVVFHLGATVSSVDGSMVRFTDKKGAEQTVEADAVLVATGRTPNTDDIGLDAAGVEHGPKGVVVDDRARTNVPGVRAAGDVTGRRQLAHFASRQATVAVMDMVGVPQRCREDAVPRVVYTDPEIASVGLMEHEAVDLGMDVRTVKFPLSNNGRFLAETDGGRGVCKAVIDNANDAVAGIHMVGPGVSEMIAAGAVAVECELRAADLAEVVFPHPTVSEAMRDVMFNA